MFWKKRKKYNLGIALGGGGARGFAHLGVMKALHEKGIKPDVISGVSAGAIAGAFLASGQSSEEAYDNIKGYHFTNITEFTLPKKGLLSLAKMKTRLQQKIAVNQLEDLEIPLIIGVSNLLDGKPEYLNEGPLAATVQASASIPLLFSPVELNGKLYADGGIFDNVPIKPLKPLCKKIIAVSISPIHPIKELKNIIQVSTRMFQLAINPSKKEITENCDLFIEPTDLSSYDLMDTKHSREIFQIGYDHVMKMDIQI